MSHELEMLNGKISMAWVGQTPWHGLGTEVSNDLTPSEMLTAANLNWNVTAKQLYFDGRVDGKTTRMKVPNKALVRDVDNKVLSVVSKGWNPVQNSEAFDFFARLVESGKMEMHTAGSLMGGRRVWALAKINEAFDLRVNGKVTKDNVQGYLLLTNPHEYGKSIDARVTSVRVVCNNTFQVAMGGKNTTAVSLDHRRAFDADKLQRLLGVAHIGIDEYKEAAEFLASKRYNIEQARDLFRQCFPYGNGEAEKSAQTSRMAQAAEDILETQPGADFAPGTWWNVFNAVTFAVDHLAGVNQDSRLTSSWYGHARGRKTDAMNLAVQYAKAA